MPKSPDRKTQQSISIFTYGSETERGLRRADRDRSSSPRSRGKGDLSEIDLSDFTALRFPSRRRTDFLAPNRTDVDASVFTKDLDATLAVLRDAFQGALSTPIGGLSIDEIEVALEVGAEGKVGILGSGASVSGKSSLTVHFKRH